MNSPIQNNMPDFCDRHHPTNLVTAFAWLRKLGVKPSQISLLAIGKFLNYRGEIHGQRPEPGEHISEETEIHLEIGYQSMVDYLPYQFFYGIKGLSPQAPGNWEDSARRLMSPFDAAAIKWRVRAIYERLRFACPTVDPEQSKNVAALFGAESFSGRDQEKNDQLSLAVLPSFHLWSGNAEGTARFLSAKYNRLITIRENVEAEQQIPEGIQSRLGQQYSELGRSIVLGKSYTESESTYEVIVHDVDIDEAEGWLPKGEYRSDLDQVVRLTMPSELDYRICIKFRQGHVKLGDAGNQSYLGLSSILSELSEN